MVLVIGLEGHYDREPRREQFTVHGMFGRNVSDWSDSASRASIVMWAKTKEDMRVFESVPLQKQDEIFHVLL